MNACEIIVRVVDLPYTAKGFIAPDPDGVYNIYINSRLSFDEQFNTLLHELKHAVSGDCHSDSPVSLLECG